MCPMKIITTDHVREWYVQSPDLAEYTRGIGQSRLEPDELGRQVDLPYHLQFAIENLVKETPSAVSSDVFNSIPFFSLCKGLFLPLAALTPQRVGQYFGIDWQPPKEDSAALIRKFFAKDIGLTFRHKVACLLGDAFQGRKGTLRRDSLIRLYQSMRMASKKQLLDRLTVVGDIAVLFAESTEKLKGDLPLTSLEVLETLRFIPGQRLNRKLDVLRSLYQRTGKLERYFLCKLVLRAAGFGFDYQGPLLAKAIAEKFNVPPETVEHASALTDFLTVATTLETEGPDGLRRIQLQPLSPIRPALAGGQVEDIRKFPVWVERKYDGVRMLLHKSTDDGGAVLCGAYTRNRIDWLELVTGMSRTIPMIPGRSFILDGELHGTIVDVDGIRPASVYEVYTTLQGEPVRPVQMKFAAFDLLYLNGQDLTSFPLSVRRQQLAALLAPLANWPLPVPIALTEGQMAQSKDDLNRLFHHFRAQGYEGIIAKEWNGQYHINTRDPAWSKRKPEITLDLALMGGVYAVTSKEKAGLFGSYVIGARDGSNFVDVGDVAGVDAARDKQMQSEIMRLGLLTGRRIERPSASGVRPGLEFRPAIVVTVRFEGIVRDAVTKKFSLRDPKIVLIRSDKSAFECDEASMLEKLYLDQRLS